ncbi:hypothetical protein JHD47_06320 [Sulfurimonas sp. SAG-AH-194-L11]|nr:hypothetical protein [Sulfurimonas sp. SAG-AH-194-L11]MDF1877428.1 hypothetical protein [Sulfurimonas sp. SAG-AH-194-L11]
MSKAVQAFLSGMLITFILDFFLFLGIFENYIKAKEIDVYYNILFADHQSLIIFLFFTLILGYITLYKGTKLTLIVIGSLSIITLSTLITPIGSSFGEALLMKSNVEIHMSKYSYRGDILYNGRDTLTFYDYNFKKVLHLDKNKIIGEY